MPPGAGRATTKPGILAGAPITARAECQREGGSHALLPGPDRPRRRRPHHGDADLASRPRRSRLPGQDARPALPGRERAAPDRRSGRPATRPRRVLRGAARAARLARVPGPRGGRDHGAQELRRHRFLHSRGPRPRPRSPRLLEPARLQHVPQHAPARHGTRRRATWPTPPPRAHNRGMLEFCSADPRLLPSLLRPPGRPGPRRRRHRGRPGAGRSGPPHRFGLPARALAQPHRPVRRVGPGRGGRHPGRVPRRGHGDARSTPTTSSTASPSRPTSTAARRTSGPSTTWASRSRRPRRWPR